MFIITKDLEEILTKKGKEMLLNNTEEMIVTVPGTKIELIFVKAILKNKYTDTILKEVIINKNIFYLSR
jgi:hypothetical protein